MIQSTGICMASAHFNALECVITPEQYATHLINTIDSSNNILYLNLIATEIRRQWELYIETHPEEYQSYRNCEDFSQYRFQIELDVNTGSKVFNDKFTYPLFPSAEESPYFTACRICSNEEMHDQFIPIVAWSIIKELCAARLSFDEQYKRKLENPKDPLLHDEACTQAMQLGCYPPFPKPENYLLDYTSGMSAFGHQAYTFQIQQNTSVKSRTVFPEQPPLHLLDTRDLAPSLPFYPEIAPAAEVEMIAPIVIAEDVKPSIGSISPENGSNNAIRRKRRREQVPLNFEVLGGQIERIRLNRSRILPDGSIIHTLEEIAKGKKHRGFGASAKVFNEDGSVDFGGIKFIN